jgi:hypothetical protein
MKSKGESGAVSIYGSAIYSNNGEAVTSSNGKDDFEAAGRAARLRIGGSIFERNNQAAGADRAFSEKPKVDGSNGLECSGHGMANKTQTAVARFFMNASQ